MQAHKEVRVMEGDWMCTKCNEHNFARRWTCFRCGAVREADSNSAGATGSTGSASSTSGTSTDGASSQSQTGRDRGKGPTTLNGTVYYSERELSGRRDGDWNCPRCNALNFARRAVCFGCNTPKDPSAAASAATDNSQMLKGDWLCMNCRSHNFARRKICFGCSSPRYSLAYGASGSQSSSELYGGDWICLRCNEHNFARRVSCFGCNADKPTEAELSAAASGASASGYSTGSSSSGAAGASTDSKSHQGGHNGVPLLGGDWICPKCNEHNFARRYACFGCNAPKHHSSIPSEDDSWVCMHCSERNSMWYYLCLKCASPRFSHDMLYSQSSRHAEVRPRPSKGGAGSGGVMSGDWFCSKCSSHNFARRLSCFSCGTGKESAMTMY